MDTLDFTSCNYLGLWHGHSELRPWQRLSSGVPAAASGGNELENALVPRLAQLQCCEAALLGRSTLHLFRDLFAALSRESCAIYLDEGSYSCARWGAEWARAAGRRVRDFAHHDPSALQELLEESSGELPVVVVDGVSSRQWSPAPLPEYQALLRARGGLLVVDDTHAVGLLGSDPSSEMPLGQGGGGSLPWHGLDPDHVLMVSSLGKAFGVPVAVLSGSAERVAWFEDRAETRKHCSAPTAPELIALERALDANETEGDTLRDRLTRNILLWRDSLLAGGIASMDPIHPVQFLRLPRSIAPESVDAELLARGVRLWLQRRPTEDRALAVLSAVQSDADVQRGAWTLLEVLEELATLGFLK